MRLDCYLAHIKMVRSRSEAVNLIKLGAVYINDKVVTTSSTEINRDSPPTISIQTEVYASIGALKLKAAFDEWKIDCSNAVALDVGASTGGFTDLLLKRGASYVYAVNVGEGLLREEIRADSRVAALENTNARQLDKQVIDKECNIITVDLSFISLKKVLANLKQFLSDKGIIIALIKPQFELGKYALNKKGIVKSEKLALSAVQAIKDYALECGYYIKGCIQVPSKFEKKNREYLIYLTLQAN